QSGDLAIDVAQHVIAHDLAGDLAGDLADDSAGDLAGPSAVTTRSISMRATSSLVWVGQSSTPSAVTRWMVLRSPPMTPDSADTSLARIQSQRLRASFPRACSTTFSVSAARPVPRSRPRGLPPASGPASC